MDPQETMRANRTVQFQAGSASTPVAGDAQPARTRRAFMNVTARRLAYTAPLVLLFHPQRACASGGSQITP